MTRNYLLGSLLFQFLQIHQVNYETLCLDPSNQVCLLTLWLGLTVFLLVWAQMKKLEASEPRSCYPSCLKWESDRLRGTLLLIVVNWSYLQAKIQLIQKEFALGSSQRSNVADCFDIWQLEDHLLAYFMLSWSDLSMCGDLLLPISHVWFGATLKASLVCEC